MICVFYLILFDFVRIALHIQISHSTKYTGSLFHNTPILQVHTITLHDMPLPHQNTPCTVYTRQPVLHINIPSLITRDASLGNCLSFTRNRANLNIGRCIPHALNAPYSVNPLSALRCRNGTMAPATLHSSCSISSTGWAMTGSCH